MRLLLCTGCFDHEEEAARAYDKMMLWCELHNTAGVKGGITNYDPSEYDKDIPWLQSISQVRVCCKRGPLLHQSSYAEYVAACIPWSVVLRKFC